MKKQDLVIVTIFLLLVGFLFKTTIDYLDLPVVQFNSSNECVKVLYTDEHSCDNLPAKYINERVR